MPLHHYLPATFLAGFSTETGQPRRDRKIAVHDRLRQRTFMAPCSRLGAVNDLYTRTLTPGVDVDATWAGYEKRLAEAVDALVSARSSWIDAQLWARVLVPFVACLFVRGPDFSDRFNRRPAVAASSDFVDPEENANQGRLLELQRLLAPVMTSRWVVMHAPGQTELITNDIALCSMSYGSPGGFAVPLDRRRVLAILPTRIRTIVQERSGEWRAIVEHRSIPKDWPGLPALRGQGTFVPLHSSPVEVQGV